MMNSKSQSDEQRTDEIHIHGGDNNLDNIMERKSEVEKEEASAAKKSLPGHAQDDTLDVLMEKASAAMMRCQSSGPKRKREEGDEEEGKAVKKVHFSQLDNSAPAPDKRSSKKSKVPRRQARVVRGLESGCLNEQEAEQEPQQAQPPFLIHTPPVKQKRMSSRLAIKDEQLSVRSITMKPKQSKNATMARKLMNQSHKDRDTIITSTAAHLKPEKFEAGFEPMTFTCLTEEEAMMNHPKEKDPDAEDSAVAHQLPQDDICWTEEEAQKKYQEEMNHQVLPVVEEVSYEVLLAADAEAEVEAEVEVEADEERMEEEDSEGSSSEEFTDSQDGDEDDNEPIILRAVDWPVEISEAAATQKKRDQAIMRMTSQPLFIFNPFTNQLPARIYHQAPYDILELVVLSCSDGKKRQGGLNVFRLVNQRLMNLVETNTTSLTHRDYVNGPDLLPTSILKRCKRVEDISIMSGKLTSLEGCPSQLKSLQFQGGELVDLSPLSACPLLEQMLADRAFNISDLSPLASCRKLETLRICDSKITDLSAASTMDHLKTLVVCCTVPSSKSFIKDLTPLSSCKNLEYLELTGHSYDLKDLSPLNECKKLKELILIGNDIDDLSFLSHLPRLEYITMEFLLRTTSLLPILRCQSLKYIDLGYGWPKACKEILLLKEKKPGLEIITRVSPQEAVPAAAELQLVQLHHLYQLLAAMPN